MIRAAPLLLALSLAVAACDAPTAPAVAPLGQAFWLGYGQAVRIPASPGTLRFVQLLEDSRCPVGPLIACAWAGRVRLRLAAESGTGSVNLHELRLLDAPSAIAIDGLLVQLLAVAPEAQMEAQPVSEYRARLLITAVR